MNVLYFYAKYMYQLFHGPAAILFRQRVQPPV